MFNLAHTGIVDMVRAFFASLILCISLAVGATASFAQQSWVQVESHPSLRTAQERARSYGLAFNEVAGFVLAGGWYTLALGPYPDPASARTRLRELRAQGVIPRDSYVTDGSAYSDQFWPVGAGVTGIIPPIPETVIPETAIPETTTPETALPETATPAPEAVIIPQIIIPEIVTIDETPREARASERLLDREGREELQIALQWFGFYTAAIDGSFGRGTRGSMARWQTAQG